MKDLYPGEPKGSLARHLNTLASMIGGIVGSRSTNLPAIAGKTTVEPDKDGKTANRESRVKRFSRWIDNEHVDMTLFFLPFAQSLLASLAHLPLVLALDGSVVGRDCVALMIGVVYKQRLLPLAWLVREGKKGHFPEQIHLEILGLVRPIIPSGAEVILLGDGEFDGVGYQTTLRTLGWKYVSRTAKNIKLFWQGSEFCFEDMGRHIHPGEGFVAPDVLFTEERYGPVVAIAWWRKDCAEPLYLVTNLKSAEQASSYYRKRFKIETFFSDQKSRGFYLHKSLISDPGRLATLMIAACLAYHWMIYLGLEALRNGWHRIFHRKTRCDLSLFQLGMNALDYLLDEDMPIKVAFGRV